MPQIGTDYGHYKQVLERAHKNLLDKDKSSIASIKTIRDIDNDPTYADTLPISRSATKIPKYPCKYLIYKHHTTGLTLTKAAWKLGVSASSVQ